MRVDGHLLDSESSVFKDIEELIKSGFPHEFEAVEIEHTLLTFNYNTTFEPLLL